jgi:hypothetical protein
MSDYHKKLMAQRPRQKLKDVVLIGENGRHYPAELWDFEHWFEPGVNSQSSTGWTTSMALRFKINGEFYPEQAKPLRTFVVPGIGLLKLLDSTDHLT